VFGIALGYEDLIDHDDLRRDPVLGAVLGRLEAKRPGLAPLAGKSTLNRLEHAPAVADRYRRIGHDGAAVADLFVELFLEAHDQPPARITLDLDATDDPIHGEQEGRFFHGYYDCYCYLPLYVFCGDHLLAAKLRRANIDASAGAVEEVARIVGRIRAAWPRVQILLRADSGFAREELMAWAEASGVDYLFGLARNDRLVAQIAPELARAQAAARRFRRPARRFADFPWATRTSWSRSRRVVAKAEWMPGRGEDGANPRFVVTSLAAEAVAARALYERLYCARGDMENRIKECQLDLFAEIGVPRSLLRGVGPHQRRDHARQPAQAVVRRHGLRARQRPAPARARRDPLRPCHLRHHPHQALQDRRARHRQRPPRARRHGLRLPLRRRLPPRAPPIVRLTRTSAPRPSRARNPPNPAALAPLARRRRPAPPDRNLPSRHAKNPAEPAPPLHS
jgi:hypothetical protein